MIFPAKQQLINIHTHRKAQNAQEWILRNAYYQITENQLENINYALSMGIHPWHCQNIKAAAILENIFALPQILAIGEIGLDRKIAIPLAQQMEVFEAQLYIAQKLHKPVLIHAVKSHSDMLPLMRKYAIPFIFHGFMGNTETAKMLLKQGGYLSFGASMGGGKLDWGQIPLSQIFLETDTAAIAIAEIYLRATEKLNISMENLKNQIYTNFITVFNSKNDDSKK